MRVELDGLKFVLYEFENRIAKFDLTLQAIEDKNGIGFNLEYCTKLFKKETIQNLSTHFEIACKCEKIL